MTRTTTFPTISMTTPTPTSAPRPAATTPGSSRMLVMPGSPRTLGTPRLETPRTLGTQRLETPRTLGTPRLETPRTLGTLRTPGPSPRRSPEEHGNDRRRTGPFRGCPVTKRRGAHRDPASRPAASGGAADAFGVAHRGCRRAGVGHPGRDRAGPRHRRMDVRDRDPVRGRPVLRAHAHRDRSAVAGEIGRASCRARV